MFKIWCKNLVRNMTLHRKWTS